MAEATQATTTTATETPVTTTATATPAPVAAAAVATPAPVAPPAAQDTTQSKRLTAMDRADAAIAKHEAAEKAKAASAAETPPAKPADKTAETATDPEKKSDAEAAPADAEKAKAEADEAAKKKAAEEAAKAEPRLSRAMAIVAERERAVAKREATFKAEMETSRAKLESDRAAFEASKTTDAADLAFVRKVRESMAKNGRVAAAREFGFTMEELVDAKSREVEPRPEDIIAQAEERAKQAAAAEYKRLQEANEAAAKEAKAKEEEQRRAQDTVEATEFVERAAALHNADTSKRPWLALTPVNGAQLWELANQMQTELGRKALPDEVLDRAEKLLRERYQPLVSPPPAAATVPAQAQPKPAETAPPKQSEAKPVEQKRGRGPKRESPMDRAAAALHRRGWQ